MKGGNGSGRVVAVLASLGVLLLCAAAQAQVEVPSGSTLSPDLRSFMVNKDLGNERWTINLNLFSTDPGDVISATGNIFRSDGGPASFVVCLMRADSTGSLTDFSSTFRFSCSGADACPSTAETCAQTAWTPISDDVQVPASFFLPPDGLGGVVAGADASSGSFAAAAARREALLRAGWTPPRALPPPVAAPAGIVESLLVFAGDAFDAFRRWTIAQRGLDLRARDAFAQAGSARGATLTIDRLNFLVTKDVGAERWSISYSLEPALSPTGGVVSQFLSVTGNVFQPDGSPPSFVYCSQRPDSTGTLDDPSSEFRFSCSGTDACETTAVDCAQTEWQLIADDIPLQASFFLPPDGLPATPQSDPEIVIIGRTSDPPSIVVPDFETVQSAGGLGVPAGGCAVGADCVVASLGDCPEVRGTVVARTDVGCGCLIEEVPPACITCGSGATGQCGGSCSYGVGNLTARGTCLPFDYESEECACYAIGAGDEVPVEGCGGVLEATCPEQSCCADDPRGACDQLGVAASCPGVCVAAGGGCEAGGGRVFSAP